jgi:hydrogenase-4 component F
MLSSADWLLDGIYGPPIVVLLIAAVLWLILGRRRALEKPGNGGNIFLTWATIIASGTSVFFSIWLIQGYHAEIQGRVWPFGSFIPNIVQYNVDGLSIFFISVVNVVAFFSSIFTYQINERGGEPSTKMYKFHVYFNLFHLVMLLVPFFSNLLVVWSLIALTTVTSVPLIAFPKSRKSEDDPTLKLSVEERIKAAGLNRRSREAALKYVVISAFSLTFALLGTLLFGVALRQPLSLDWFQLQMSFHTGNSAAIPELLALSFLLILLGYGAKAGMFPMHTWLPDSHGQAPSPVSALLSGVLLKSALYVILRFFVLTSMALNLWKPASGIFAANALAAFGLLSLVMATPFILNTNPRNRFKRVLAYHSLEHMGIIMFAFGIATPLAFFGALLHVLNHGFTKALMFLGYGRVQYAYGRDKYPLETPEDESKYVQGTLQKMPVTGSILGFGGMALVGSPPFSIFFSEFIILLAAIQKWGLYPTWESLGGKVAIVLYSSSIALIFAGLTIHMGRLLLGKTPEPPPPSPDEEQAPSKIDLQKEKTAWRYRAISWTALIALLIIGMTFTTFTTWPWTNALHDSICFLSGGATCQPMK